MAVYLNYLVPYDKSKKGETNYSTRMSKILRAKTAVSDTII